MIDIMDWKKIMQKAWELLFICISPLFMFLQVELLEENKLSNIRESFYWVNYVWYALIVGFFLLLLRRISYALGAAAIASYAMGLANHYVLEFRGSPILPWDIKSLGTALQVAESYQYGFSRYTWAVSAATVLFLLFVYLLLPREKISLKNKINMGMLAAFLTFAAMVWQIHSSIGFLQLHNWTVFAWNQKVQYQCCGVAASFMENLRFMDIKEPSGYDLEEIKELAAQYKEPSEPSAAFGEAKADAAKPNIIAIMDESFADISMIKDLGEDKDYMPVFDSLAEHAIRGRLNVSAFGGNTCNTEFEFLTSLSMAFVPSGSVPYQQYVDHDLSSLCRVLKKQGYSATAIHPCLASNWHRDKVYPYLGFDEFISEADFSAGAGSYLRGYLSDAADFDRLIEEYEARKEGAPFFLFNVTMQNHGGYSDGTQMYIDLVRKTDYELGRLVKYLEEQPEPTLLLFFGDHQPNLQDGTYDEINKETDMSVYRNKYLVPFVLWANYEIGEEDLGDISPSFLAPLLLKTAGLSMPPYYWLLLDKMKEVPALSINGHLSKPSGEWLEPLQKGADEAMGLYERLQYNKLFDKKNYVPEMFE